MAFLQRATSGFHQHGFRDERRPNMPTHAAVPGARYALCGASVEQVFNRRWGVEGPEFGGCAACQAENARVLQQRVAAVSQR
jgi:hypothetical protein